MLLCTTGHFDSKSLSSSAKTPPRTFEATWIHNINLSTNIEKSKNHHRIARRSSTYSARKTKGAVSWRITGLGTGKLAIIENVECDQYPSNQRLISATSKLAKHTGVEQSAVTRSHDTSEIRRGSWTFHAERQAGQSGPWRTWRAPSTSRWCSWRTDIVLGTSWARGRLRSSRKRCTCRRVETWQWRSSTTTWRPKSSSRSSCRVRWTSSEVSNIPTSSTSKRLIGRLLQATTVPRAQKLATVCRRLRVQGGLKNWVNVFKTHKHFFTDFYAILFWTCLLALISSIFNAVVTPGERQRLVFLLLKAFLDRCFLLRVIVSKRYETEINVS